MAKLVDVVPGMKDSRRGGGRKPVPAAAGTGEAGAGEAIRAAFRDRIGSDRYAVWFGDSWDIAVDDGRIVTIRIGTAFTHDWLKRTFQHDMAAAVHGVCGPTASIAWLPTEAPEPCAAPERRPARRPRAVPSGKVARKTTTPAVTPTATPQETTAQEPAPRDMKAQVGRQAGGQVGRQAGGQVGRQAAGLADFVTGPSNRMAVAAIERVAARPGELSPLVIHGPSGVGKTHLLDAVCSRARELHPGLTVVSLSAEQFTTSFLQALHHSGLPGFRRSCRSADLLVIDDIHFLAGKRATTLEFQHTVDALHRHGRQMVFACDRELDALSGLGSDVLTRLRGGMTARIEPPDYEVRRGIVAGLAGRRGLALPDDVVHHVATHITRHAREIYGAINRLEATSLMLGVPVTLELAEDALADLVRSSGRSVRLADIEQAVCKAFGIEQGTLQSGRRARSASHPRMLAMFLARKHTHAALADIGRYFGRRSHSTVIAAQKTVGDWVSKRSPIVLAESQWDVEEAIRRVEDVLRAG